LSVIFFWIAYKLSQNQGEIINKQGEIVDRLNILQSAIAETQLREKITVMKQRVKMLKFKPEIGEKYPENEVGLLIGDCMAGLPLFELAPEKTRDEFITTTCEAMTSLDSQYIDNHEKHKEKLRKILAEHFITPSEENTEIIRKFDDLLEKCGVIDKKQLSSNW
jgi:hypothetical protein